MFLSYLLSVHLDVGDVILEHGGNVNLGELVFTEHDQQARLPTSAVPNDHQLLTDRRHLTTGTTTTYQNVQSLDIFILGKCVYSPKNAALKMILRQKR